MQHMTVLRFLIQYLDIEYQVSFAKEPYEETSKDRALSKEPYEYSALL